MPFRVLVVDDEPNLARSLAELLRDEGYEVQQAEDGAAALDRLCASPVDVIVSDVMMPKVDGYTLVETIRARGDPTPVILMSASGRPRTDALNVWTVAKPFDIERVLGLVEKIIETHPASPGDIASPIPFPSDPSPAF